MTISATASILSTPSGLTLDELKQALFQNVRYRLGDGIIDLELDPFSGTMVKCHPELTNLKVVYGSGKVCDCSISIVVT